MTISTVYPLVVGGGGTKLTTAFAPNDTTIYVEDASGLPTGPNYVSIIDTNFVCTYLYSTVSNNSITGLTVVEYSHDGHMHTYPVGCTVGRTINKVDIDTMNANISQKVTIDDNSTVPFAIGYDAGGVYTYTE